MLLLVPIVHRGQDLRYLVDGEHRTLGEHVELPVGDDRGDLQDRVAHRIEAGHLEVDPHQVVGRLGHLGLKVAAAGDGV